MQIHVLMHCICHSIITLKMILHTVCVLASLTQLDMDKCSHIVCITDTETYVYISHFLATTLCRTFTCIMVYNNYYSWVYRSTEIFLACACAHDTYIATLYNCGIHSLSAYQQYQLFDNRMCDQNHLIRLVG